MKDQPANHWVFRISGGSLILDKLLRENKPWTYEFTTGYNFRGAEGDPVILLVYTSAMKWVFYAYGRITEFEKTYNESTQRHFIKLTVSELTKTKAPNTLDDFAYTLTKVRDFDNPAKHFRTYSSLTPVEYNSIIQGKIFVSRTAFGKVIRALPPQHRQSFDNYFRTYHSKVYNGKKNYAEAWRILKTYVDSHILIPAQQLISARKMFAQLAGDDVANKIGFGETGLKQHNIGRQVKEIYKLEGDLPIALDAPLQKSIDLKPEDLKERKGYFFEDVGEAIEKTGEEKLNENFRKMSWPISYDYD